MEDVQSVATLLESTTSKIQQLQKAFAELESHRAVTLNLKWKQIEDHFHGLEKSLKRRFTELEDQEKEFQMKTNQSQQLMANRQAAVLAKEEASLEKLQEKRDAAVSAILQTDSIVEEKQKLSDNDIKALTNPELAKLCESNDANGLHKFISDNRKNLASIKEEIPIALKAAVNPGGLVLDSLTGFYTIEDGKKDSNLLGQRRTCIMLMECLSILLTNLDEKSVSRVICKDLKERAKVIAEEWKLKLDDLDLDASNGNSLEAHAFLQLVATFGIDSDFVDEDLVKLIPMVSRRRQTADLCRFLGLSEKMPGVIDVLVNNGRHIDGVNLAFAFELTNEFSPVLLLKSYLNLTENDASLSALKAVIKCIEDHKLEDQYPITPLQKQILNLEKAKADKKRATEPQPKRPRANANANYTPRNNNNNNNNIVSVVVSPDKKYYPRYGPPQPQPQPQPQYMYAAYSDNRIPGYMAGYNMGPPNHAHYFATAYQYQAPYLH